jgi:hypothetical protein
MAVAVEHIPGLAEHRPGLPGAVSQRVSETSFVGILANPLGMQTHVDHQSIFLAGRASQLPLLLQQVQAVQQF